MGQYAICIIGLGMDASAPTYMKTLDRPCPLLLYGGNWDSPVHSNSSHK